MQLPSLAPPRPRSGSQTLPQRRSRPQKSQQRKETSWALGRRFRCFSKPDRRASMSCGSPSSDATASQGVSVCRQRSARPVRQRQCCTWYNEQCQCRTAQPQGTEVCAARCRTRHFHTSRTVLSSALARGLPLRLPSALLLLPCWQSFSAMVSVAKFLRCPTRGETDRSEPSPASPDATRRGRSGRSHRSPARAQQAPLRAPTQQAPQAA